MSIVIIWYFKETAFVHESHEIMARKSQIVQLLKHEVPFGTVLVSIS